MNDVVSSGRSFVESVEEMVARLDRVERIVRLFARPILPYKEQLKSEKFHLYLDERCSPDWNDAEKLWVAGNLTGEFRHKQSGVLIHLPSQWDNDDGSKLVEILLTIASFEGRMPARILADIQPEVFPSAVDALATAVDEEDDVSA